MLARIKLALLKMIDQYHMVQTPPLYDPFRVPVLSHLEREREKAKRYLRERGMA